MQLATTTVDFIVKKDPRGCFLTVLNSRPGNPGGSFAYLQMMLAGFLGTRRR